MSPNRRRTALLGAGAMVVVFCGGVGEAAASTTAPTPTPTRLHRAAWLPAAGDDAGDLPRRGRHLRPGDRWGPVTPPPSATTPPPATTQPAPPPATTQPVPPTATTQPVPPTASPSGTPPPIATPTVAPAPTAPPSSGGAQLTGPAMFDDFSYATTGSPAANGWSIRGEGGSPGPAGSAFDPSLVSFSESGGQTVMQLDAVTDGTPAGTRQAEIASPEKYLEGTYAARVYFTDRPAGGGTGSKINQTFFTINGEDGSGYSELDFEYLSAGGWGSSGPTMFETSWATPGDPVSDQQGSSLAGWHDLAMTVTGGTVTYLVDGQPVARHSGEHYPDSPMAIDFNQWFLSLAPDGLDGPGAWTMQVDYVLFAGGEALSPARIDSAVAAYRATGVAFTDTVG